jgi:hypothetical protein
MQRTSQVPTPQPAAEAGTPLRGKDEGGLAPNRGYGPESICPWELPAPTCIGDGKERDRKHTIRSARQQRVPLATSWHKHSEINGEIGVAACIPQLGAKAANYMGANRVSTVYAAELRRLQLALDLAMQAALVLERSLSSRTTKLPSRQSPDPEISGGQYLAQGVRAPLRAVQALGIKVRIYCVPAQVGVEGDELADKIAKEATGWCKGDGNSGPQVQASKYRGLRSLYAAAKRTAKADTDIDWSLKWAKGDTGRELHRLAPEVTKQRFKLHKGLPKALSAIPTQRQMGKTALKGYLHRIKRVPNARCSCSSGNQTVRHVLTECPNLRGLRRAIWAS